ncbi:MAG: putative Holliday junction resolvase [Planctomycetota bacterium]|jgi:putative Holliday junction resolvase
MGSVLSIDHGTKKTGFAIADPLRIAVHALEQVAYSGESEELLDYIEKMLTERDVEIFLLGMPYNMDGTEGGRAEDVHRFAARLTNRFPKVGIRLWDERLTTKAAEEMLRQSGFSGRQAKGRKDSWSALVLLRDWIESGEPETR